MREINRPSTANCTLSMYISYILSEPKYINCSRLGELMDISHDSVNRFLNRENLTPKDLFLEAKSQLNLESNRLVSIEKGKFLQIQNLDIPKVWKYGYVILGMLKYFVRC